MRIFHGLKIEPQAVVGRPARVDLRDRALRLYFTEGQKRFLEGSRGSLLQDVRAGQREAAVREVKASLILDKIAEGKLNAWFKDNVLVEQPFVKDPGKTVGQILKAAGLEAVKFVRMKVGELS